MAGSKSKHIELTEESGIFAGIFVEDKAEIKDTGQQN